MCVSSAQCQCNVTVLTSLQTSGDLQAFSYKTSLSSGVFPDHNTIFTLHNIYNNHISLLTVTHRGVSPGGMWGWRVFITDLCVRLHTDWAKLLQRGFGGRWSSNSCQRSLQAEKGGSPGLLWHPIMSKHRRKCNPTQCRVNMRQCKQVSSQDLYSWCLIGSESWGFCKQWGTYFLFPVSTSISISCFITELFFFNMTVLI